MEINQFSKATGSWVLKNKYAKSTNTWKYKKMEKVKQLCTGKITDKITWVPQCDEVEVPDCIAPIPKSSIEEMRKQIFFRFS